MKKLTILPGRNKQHIKESFKEIVLELGNIVAIVGNTGSGKSRFIKDIEQLVNQDSITQRQILIDDKKINIQERTNYKLIAHLSQNMRFMLDTSVQEFIDLHNACRNKNISSEAVLEVANAITNEAITLDMSLNLLSGGQSRALMIADIALICDSPIILIDEIENAGIDKIKALKYLIDNQKLVLLVTHDPHTALLANSRIIMKQGGVHQVLQTTAQEKQLYQKLNEEYYQQLAFQAKLRQGEHIA